MLPNKIIAEQSALDGLAQCLERFVNLMHDFEDIQSQIDEISDECGEQEQEHDTFY